MQTESILNSFENDKVSLKTYHKKSNASLALQDFKEGLVKWRIWGMLAYHDIRLKYRRSILGPLWLTLSMAITVYFMGFLYGNLFKIEINDYFPYLVAGMLAWSLISSNLNELTDTFTYYESLLKEIKLPYTLHIYRIILRNIFVFFHNIIVMIPVYFFLHKTASINLNTLYIFPALLIFSIFSVFLGLLLAMIAARYRDISQLIKNLIQVIFFITPVMWKPEVLSANKIIIVWGNPIYPFLELIRAPILGKSPPPIMFALSIIITAIILVCTITVFTRYRSRIIYWL